MKKHVIMYSLVLVLGMHGSAFGFVEGSFLPSFDTDKLEQEKSVSLLDSITIWQAGGGQLDIPPLFPGGSKALDQFISRTMRYPASALMKGIQGQVVCQFTVKKNGLIAGATVIERVEQSLDKEALRVISAMPKWHPAQSNGKAVSQQFVLPITFELKEKGPLSSPPSFPGGADRFQDFIRNTLKYPDLALEQGIQGVVYCQFFIDKDGSIVDAVIVKSVHPLLDREVLRLISRMPKWKPGMVNGEPVRVKFTVPFTFTPTPKW